MRMRRGVLIGLAFHFSALLIVPSVSWAQSDTARQLFLSATTGGVPVRGLRVDEVVLQQTGAVCTVVSLEPETDRMKIALLIDNSPSARFSLNPLREGLRNFLDELPAQHEVGLFTTSHPRLRVDFTTDRDALREEVARTFATGGGALVDSLYETWERRFDDADAWPVFVVVSQDGPESSATVLARRVDGFTSELMARGATVHAVLVIDQSGAGAVVSGVIRHRFVDAGIGIQEAVTSHLTRMTGGIFTPIVAGSGLPASLSNLAADMGAHHDAVKDRYRVGYECEPDTGLAGISATGTRPAMTLRVFLDRSAPGLDASTSPQRPTVEGWRWVDEIVR
jgi:hypothetical protein